MGDLEDAVVELFTQEAMTPDPPTLSCQPGLNGLGDPLRSPCFLALQCRSRLPLPKCLAHDAPLQRFAPRAPLVGCAVPLLQDVPGHQGTGRSEGQRPGTGTECLQGRPEELEKHKWAADGISAVGCAATF